MKRAILILLLLLCPSIALASADPAPPAAANAPAWITHHHEGDPEPPPPSPAPSRLRGVLAGILVVALIGFAIWTKTRKVALTAKNPMAYVKVTDSVKVGEKAHLVVATIGDRTVVLGVTEHGVRRLMDVEPPPSLAGAKKTALAATAIAAAPNAAKTAVGRARRLLADAVSEKNERHSRRVSNTDESSDDIEEQGTRKVGPKSSSAMIAAASIKSRFQSILNLAKHPSANRPLLDTTASFNDESDDTDDSFDDDGSHWTEKLDNELRASQNEESERDAAPPPGGISAPLLRVANDTSERVRMRLSGSHAIDPLGVEEQVQGILTARARRS